MPPRQPKVEVELKVQVPVGEVDNIKKVLVDEAGMDVQGDLTQVSYFYDTAERDLTKKGISLRLREVALGGGRGWWEVCIKGPGEVRAGAICRHEEERRICRLEALRLKSVGGNGLLDCLYYTDFVRNCKKLIGGRPLLLFDSFKNRRLLLGPFLNPSTHIELDVTTFSYKGHTLQAAEIECEVPMKLIDRAQGLLLQLVRKAVPCVEPTPSVGKRTRMQLFKKKIDSKL